MLAYLWRVLRALDRLGNALTGGSDYHTITERAAVAERRGSLFPCLLCRFLDLFEKDHCDRSLREGN